MTTAQSKQLQEVSTKNCGNQMPFFKPSVQAKLSINQPNDEYEQEADAVANRIMRMADVESKPFFSPGFDIQRTCKHCEEEKKVHRKVINSEPANAEANLESYVSSLHGGGNTLPAEVRNFFEPRFGRDFSDVKIHAGALATKSAQSIQAMAYTSGNNIVFNEGQYSPDTDKGKRLLGHELTHVIQQGNNINRQIIQKTNCSAARSCTAAAQCPKTDRGTDPTTSTASTSWSLTINVDTERSDWDSALRNTEFGHTHVRFAESNGDEYSYGFYPGPAIPNENNRSVPGCVNHPDTAHDACTDRAVTFSLTHAQYTAALNFAQSFCTTGHYYGINASGLSYTCTTYASQVASAAGRALPSSASAPTTVYFQYVPSVDNPNTLLENMESQHVGVGNDATEVTDFIHTSSAALLGVMTRQEKVRLITVILNAWYISDRDVYAIERLCGSVPTPQEMTFIRTAITPLIVPHMSDIGQRTRVRVALVRI